MTERPEQNDASEKKHIQQPAAVSQETQPARVNNDRVDSMRDANLSGARTALKEIDGANPLMITGLDESGSGATEDLTRKMNKVPGGRDKGLEPKKPEAPVLPTAQPGDVTAFGQHKPGQRAAVVIDDRSSTNRPGLMDHIQTSHGDLLDQGFDAMGFNVFKQDGTQAPRIAPYKYDWSVPLNKTADFISKNRDQFPEGSFVNVSMGNPKDLSYEQVNKMTGLSLNPENVRENREQLLQRLQLVADGKDPVTGKPNPKGSAEDRAIAGAAVRSNAAIDRLQSMGIEVIHSAGNDGPNRLDINFLKATEISAVGPDGKPIPGSAIPNTAQREFSSVVFNKTGPNEASTEIHGRVLRFPLTAEGRAAGDVDREVNFGKLVGGSSPEEMFPVATKPMSFDTKSLSLGFAQNIYGPLGPRIDHASGTSFGALNYIARTRAVPDVPTP